MKAPSEEIYGKEQWVTTLSLAIRVYLHSFTCCCFPNLWNLV